MAKDDRIDREKAMDRVLGVLRSRIAIMSPSYGDAVLAINEHGLTLDELMAYAKKETCERS